MDYTTNIRDITYHTHSMLNFMAGICNKLNVNKIINELTEKPNGRKTEIPYGVLGTLMISILAEGYIPLYRLEEYFSDNKIDLEGIYKEKINIDKITDDRLAKFLDAFYDAGAKNIFSKISTNAILEYGIEVKSVNFDTTSKVMWGEYQTEDGKIGKVEINFGHSKNKRNDKKQIKFGLGTANGCIVDADVLSGNSDDKTFNSDKIDSLDEILQRTNTNHECFYYIADSAMFSNENIIKMNKKKLKFITRMPGNVKVCKKTIKNMVDKIDELEKIELTNKNNTKAIYNIGNCKLKYKENTLNAGIYYSHSLIKNKEITINKKVSKENENINLIKKQYLHRKFACIQDAKIEITKLKKDKIIRKLKFTNIDLNIVDGKDIGEYFINFNICKNDLFIQDEIKRSCMFILVTNDLNMSAYDILCEYKKQISVENKFKQLKSSHFIDSLFLKIPKRIEALSYLLLITLMILSVVEHVVRREMANADDIVIGLED